MNKEIKVWLMAVALAGAVFGLLVRPGLVQALTRQEVHGLYLSSLGVVARDYLDENGYRQIEYQDNNERVKLTKDNFPHANPDAAGEWITWMAQIGGSWQIFLYSLMSQETVQLTGVGNNVNPVVSKKYVAWEGLVDGGWRLFLFDGASIRQLTEGESITDIDLNDDWLVYRQREMGGGGWRLKVRSLLADLVVDLGLGMEPKLTEDRLTWLTDAGGKLIRQEYRFSEEPTVTATQAPTEQPTNVVTTTPTVEASPEATEGASPSPTASEGRAVIEEVVEASSAATATESASF